MTTLLQSQDFDSSALLRSMSNGKNIGAVVMFIGYVREFDNRGLRLLNLEIDHYPEMAKIQLARIEERACKRWQLEDILIVHRYGKLLPGEQIVLVIATAQHRQEAFEAAEYIMDFLKSSAPFWKKEQFKKGSFWVKAKNSDLKALGRWDKS